MVSTVLHVGCGPQHELVLHPFFRTENWREVRLDLDPNVRPDIVSSITDMSVVATQSVDAIYSAHNLEHLYPTEVPVALTEFNRVLAPGGVALLIVPDLQSVAALVAEDKLDEAAYVSPMGPITPLDIIYGLSSSLAQGNLYMAHHTGFTARTFQAALMAAGFAGGSIQRNPGRFSLWALAFKTAPDQATLVAWQKGCFSQA